MTDPDGVEWIVGRRWLVRMPRWRGFRFGIERKEPRFEPPAVRRTPVSEREREVGARIREAHDDPGSPEPVLRRSDAPPGRAQRVDHSRGRRRRPVYIDPYPGPRWIPIPTGGGRRGSGGGSGGGGSGGVGRGGSGGISRGGSGGSSRGGSGGSSRDGGGIAKAAGGAGAALIGVLKYIGIVLLVMIAAAIVIFVLLPLAVLILELLLFLLVTGATLAWRAMTGRPWIVEARQNRPAPIVHAWRVTGFRASHRVIDEIAEDLRHGRELDPGMSEAVLIVDEDG